MKIRHLNFFILLIVFNSCNKSPQFMSRDFISLQGQWQFSLDTSESGIEAKWFNMRLPDVIELPGTLDENKKGFLNQDTTQTMRLSRERIYEGWAWYRKNVTISNEYKGKLLQLIIERAKPSSVWIDSLFAGSNNSILTSQVYDLTKYLTPGVHVITILINNGRGSVPDGIKGSHAWTEHTQTNWNGIIGKFGLEVSSVNRIESIKIFPDIVSKSIHIKTRIFSGKPESVKVSLVLKAEAWNSRQDHKVPANSYSFNLKPGYNDLDLDYNLRKKTLFWSEYDPVLYKLSVSLCEPDETDSRSITFGMRKFSTLGTQFTINNKVTFLRGKHDACVFPLTGHPPMDVESWRRVFRIAKSYGINFYRFHSWTPPEAAFEAADIEGIYMQPELPFWGSLSSKRNTDLNDYLLKTGNNILDEFANHPSFVMFALGNELSGDQEVMNKLLENFRLYDGRPLLAYGSNNYLGKRGQAPGEDYYAGCRIGADTGSAYSTHIRASFSFADAFDGGYINGRYPSTQQDYSQAISKCTVPALGTEVGQYQVYPDYNEISKYTGVLKPWNLKVFMKRLNENNLAGQAYDFFRASGALSMICYRADIEMALRTPGFGGFHLLDLQDFPGQGTALVGVLDAFMDSKGLITPEEFSHFCNKVVPMFVTEKFCWTNTEKLRGTICIANYSGEELNRKTVSWKLSDSNNNDLFAGSTNLNIANGKLSDFNLPVIDLSGIAKPEKTVLKIKIEGTQYENSYPLWVYPSDPFNEKPDGIMIAERLDRQTIDVLKNGGRVLLFPNHKDIFEQSVGGLFTTDYWNYGMFRGISESNKKPVSPGTMGIFTNPDHPIFSEFPTESYTDWQWWPIVKNSRPFILDNTTADYKPVVWVIDNLERNHKLGLIFEFAVGNGKLLICMADLRKITSKPESRQLYRSILKYIESDKFNPSQNISTDELIRLFSSSPGFVNKKPAQNISY